MAGNNLLHFLRGSLEDAESGNLILEPGQPFYNYNKNYLTIGGKDGNTKVNGKPLTVRELVGYAGDSGSITGNVNSNKEFHLKYDDENSTLELLTPDNFVLKSGSTSILTESKLEINEVISDSVVSNSVVSSSANIYNLQFGPNNLDLSSNQTYYGLIGAVIDSNGSNYIVPVETTNVIEYVYSSSNKLLQIIPNSTGIYDVKVDLGSNGSSLNKGYIDELFSQSVQVGPFDIRNINGSLTVAGPTTISNSLTVEKDLKVYDELHSYGVADITKYNFKSLPTSVIFNGQAYTITTKSNLSLPLLWWLKIGFISSNPNILGYDYAFLGPFGPSVNSSNCIIYLESKPELDDLDSIGSANLISIGRGLVSITINLKDDAYGVRKFYNNLLKNGDFSSNGGGTTTTTIENWIQSDNIVYYPETHEFNGSGSFKQYISNWESLLGKTVTLSAQVNDQKYDKSITLPSSIDQQQEAELTYLDPAPAVISLRSNPNNGLFVMIQMYGDHQNDITFILDYVKLEEGEIATSNVAVPDLEIITMGEIIRPEASGFYIKV